MPSISLRLNVVKVSVGDASSKTEFRAIARRGVLAWRNSLLVKRIGIESRPKNEKGGCSEQSFNGCFIHCDWVNHAGLQDSVQVLALLSVSGRTGGINDCAPDPVRLSCCTRSRTVARPGEQRRASSACLRGVFGQPPICALHVGGFPRFPHVDKQALQQVNVTSSVS
jgi:hypothetical protein